MTADPAMTDAQLVARCRAGDQDAWRELVERFSRYVFAIATQAFRLAEHDAEDVFQDVFARVYESLGTLRDDAALRPWLAQVTRRHCLDRLRRAPRDQPTDEPDAEAPDPERCDRAPRRGDVTSTRAWPSCPRTAARSSTASSPGTRATARSATRSSCLPGTIASRISRCLEKLRGRCEGRKAPAAAS